MSDYKQPKIRDLLQQFPHRVILVGDSGEKDPEIYAQMRREFPGRIAAIYIRNAGNIEDKTRFQNMVLFEKAEEAVQDAVTRGFLPKECQ